MWLIEHFLLLGTREERRWKPYLIDTALATIGSLLVTGGVYAFHLYPKIPNISFLYLLVVLVLASTRGLYSAIIASIIAFLSFDYFLVNPLYTFTIGKFEEWLALFIFLVTAIITGELASALRRRAKQATRSARETRALYELVSATISEDSLDRQLHIIARAVVDIFSSAGVCDCAILLPDEQGNLTLRADACQLVEQMKLSSDEEKIAVSVMLQGHVVDLHSDLTVSHAEKRMPYRFKRILTGDLQECHYVRMLPLHVGQKVVGVVRILMKNHTPHFSIERNLGEERERLNPQTAFFWTFLDQATAVIERARLRRESLQVELWQRTDVLRSALLSSVSHDLRTPLSSIKAAASSLLQEDIQWDEEARRSFALAIEREADRLNRLVGNLLDMSRIESGVLVPEKEWYPVGELIHDVLGHMQVLLQGREVRTSIPDDLPPIELDYLQMDQVLTNLIENAVRYTPLTSPIEISVRVADGKMIMSIADSGPGIPRVDLERVFDKFYRVLGTARKGTSIMGSGLGLAVCRGLIEAHGGHIWAENREGSGAIFQFSLPLGQTEG